MFLYKAEKLLGNLKKKILKIVLNSNKMSLIPLMMMMTT